MNCIVYQWHALIVFTYLGVLNNVEGIIAIVKHTV